MIKHLIITFALVSAHSMVSGIWWSKQQPAQPQNNQLNVIEQEIVTYLQSLDTSSVTSQPGLARFVEQSLNKDIRNPQKFPQFNAYTQQESFLKDENAQEKLSERIVSIIEKFTKNNLR